MRRRKVYELHTVTRLISYEYEPTLLLNQRREKIMKKNFRVFSILTTLLLLASSFASFANHDALLAEEAYLRIEKEMQTQQVISSESKNEIELFMDLQATTPEVLKEKGYSDKEIKEIKALDIEKEFKKELMRRSKLDKKALKAKGYSDEQISQIQSLTGEEPLAELLALAATVTCSNSLKHHTYDSSKNKTYFAINFSWSWNYEPAITSKDVIGLGWNSNFVMDNAGNTDYNKHYKKYVHTANENNTTHSTSSLSEVNINTTEDKFDVAYLRSGSMDYDYYYCKSGNGTISLSETGKITEAKCAFQYGHDTYGFTPSVSAPWGLSFTISHAEATYKPSSIVSSQKSF